MQQERCTASVLKWDGFTPSADDRLIRSSSGSSRLVRSQDQVLHVLDPVMVGILNPATDVDVAPKLYPIPSSLRRLVLPCWAVEPART